MIKIDDQAHEISNFANVDHFNCKSKIAVDIWADKFDPDKIEDLNAENWVSWKKETVKVLKEFEKMYQKHEKVTNKELGGYIALSFVPLTDCWDANWNYFNILKMINDGVNVPEFRFKAIEDKFIEKMTRLCTILTNYGEEEQRLRQPWDIRQQLWVLKIENWKNIKPFAYYLETLNDNLSKVIEELLNMRKAGELRARYSMPLNYELKALLFNMVESDKVVQWLMGDTLKQDQFRFLYEVQKVVYNTCLKDVMLDEKLNAVVLSEVIPQMCAFMTMKNILRIQREKAADEKADSERQKRKALLMAETGITFSEEKEPEPEEDNKKAKAKKGGKKKEEIDPEELERRKEAKKLEAEIAKYGVSHTL